VRAYWDSSALVEAAADIKLRARLRKERGITRTHSLAEVFSAFTGGNLNLRLEADTAFKVVDNLAEELDFVDLSAQEVLSALRQARSGVSEAGASNDFLHAVAADKSGAPALLTTDQYDFTSLTDSVKVELV
jgi:predicted nucleic acid-binding protein